MNDNWETPQQLFDELDEEFGFVVDLAASANNWKCPIFFGPESDFCENALVADWSQHLKLGAGWLNPPYSRGRQRAFVQKAIEELTELGRGTVVCLLPADTSTVLFHDLLPVGEIRFLRGRVRFELGGIPADDPPRFASMLVILRGARLRELPPEQLSSWLDLGESSGLPESTGEE